MHPCDLCYAIHWCIRVFCIDERNSVIGCKKRKKKQNSQVWVSTVVAALRNWIIWLVSVTDYMLCYFQPIAREYSEQGSSVFSELTFKNRVLWLILICACALQLRLPSSVFQTVSALTASKHFQSFPIMFDSGMSSQASPGCCLRAPRTLCFLCTSLGCRGACKCFCSLLLIKQADILLFSPFSTAQENKSIQQCCVWNTTVYVHL